MISSVLIANRGEIARRIGRTARELGIRVIAVYSEADRDAPHVREADEAYCIGPAPATQSYLKFEAIVSIAKETGTEAIHPGYGFLAENAEFAQACADAGIAFVGPSPDAICAMGDKAAAKAIMEKAGVPVVPGYHGKDQKAAKLLAEAEKIGWPVLLKASAGGGGKGMRIVRGKKEFDDALASAKRESKAAFGDDRMLVEKYIERPRHIEVQVFGDAQGNVVHLFERDCSVQRRHQKVIEEAPAPGVTEEWRERICAAAVAAARAVDYRGAGTVEFIDDSGTDGAPGGFWFMEMNTRLQVEHPVTEAITGTDLVEWQFRVASGEPLPLAQEDLSIEGHAMEARLYAEDPSNGFLPSPGRLRYFELPLLDEELRADAGPEWGDDIPPDYDPMIAKLIAWGETRDEAAETLADSLDEVRVIGVATNAEFLARTLRHPEFMAGGVDTGFIERNLDDLLPAGEAAPEDVLAVACVALLLQGAGETAEAAHRSTDPWSPWARADGWRLNDVGHLLLRLIDRDEEIDIACRADGEGWVLDLPSGRAQASVREDWPDPEFTDPQLLGGNLTVTLGGRKVEAAVIRDGNMLHVFGEFVGHWPLGIYDPLAAAEAHEGAAGGLTAPMPGKVTALHVKAGDAVKAGQPLIVVEAMKMEHTIHAPADGKVAEVRFHPGDQVGEGEVLIVVEEATL
jgi:3-methylcrotonyl-CoA carboxylase alpha subunit